MEARAESAGEDRSQGIGGDSAILSILVGSDAQRRTGIAANDNSAAAADAVWAICTFKSCSSTKGAPATPQ